MSAGNRGVRILSITVLSTPVEIQPLVLLNVAGLWAMLAYLAGRRGSARPLCWRIWTGFLGMLALMTADLGHAAAHILSARWADAPMDMIQVSAGMPRTIYYQDDVSPRAHRLRAIGGPLFNVVGLLLSLLQRAASAPDSIWRTLADWSCLAHGFLLGGSLMPLPMVDGGSILKWSLVEGGQTPAEADETVRQAGVALAVAGAAAGAVMAAKRRWLQAAGLIVAGLLALGLSCGKQTR
jgi:hypothetical protein